MRITHVWMVLAFAITACQKSIEPVEPEPAEPIIELGKVDMDRDGQHWAADFSGYYSHSPEHLSFSFSSKNTLPNGIKEFIGIADVPSRAGKFKIAKTVNWGDYLSPKARISWSVDGDQLLGMVSADSTYYNDNFVEVIRYDSIEDVVEGRFQGYLKKSLGTPAAFGLPEAVSLTNGRFHLKVEE